MMTNVDETLEKMSETVEDIKEFAKEKAEGQSDSSKEKVNKLVTKADQVINDAKTKVIQASETIKDDEQLNSFLNNVIIKVQEASDFTKMKISEIMPEREKIEEFEKEIADSFDKFTESEGVQTVVKSFQNLSDQINDYLAKPEVRARINKAKKATLKAAEKGMDQLRRLLEVEEDEEDEQIFIDNDQD